MATPFDAPELWDVFLVSGLALPGIAVLDAASLESGWDEQKGQGQSGATVKYTGDGLAKPKVRLTLWKREHFTAWDAALKVLQAGKPEKGRKAQALDVSHPELERLGIRSLVVTSIGQLKHEGGGRWTVEISFLQYRAPAPASGSPKTSKSGENTAGANGGAGGSGTPQTTADDEREKLIADLTAKAEALG